MKLNKQASRTKTIKTENNQIKSNDAIERANAFPPFTSTLWTLNWIWLIDNHSKVPSVAAALFCCKPISCLQQLTPHSYPPEKKLISPNMNQLIGSTANQFLFQSLFEAHSIRRFDSPVFSPIIQTKFNFRQTKYISTDFHTSNSEFDWLFHCSTKKSNPFNINFSKPKEKKL